jgi:hypothetical protein
VGVPSWIPRDTNFFDLFERTTATIVEGARYLEKLVQNPIGLDVRLNRLRSWSTGRRHTRDLERLNKTAHHALRSRGPQSRVPADDVLDWLEETGQRYGIYKVTEAKPEAVSLLTSPPAPPGWTRRSKPPQPPQSQ